MSIYDRAMAQLLTLEQIFGFNPTQVEQKDDAWHIMKAGVLSASNADKIVAKRDSEGRASYMASLINQVCSCTIPDELPFKQLEHGNLYEPVARDALSAALGFVEIKELPFVYMNSDMRAGVSPDGLFDNTIIEIKAPYDGANFIKFAALGGNKKSWLWQAQFQIFATGAEQHIFAQYDPRMVLCRNLHHQVTDIDAKMQETLRDAVPQFIADMDEALESIGAKFGQHWDYFKQQRAGK